MRYSNLLVKPISDLKRVNMRNMTYLAEIEQAISFLPSIITRSANYHELGTCDGLSPYQIGLNEIDHAIGLLKRTRRDVQELAQHIHDWSPESGFCYTCGQDGNV